MTSSTGKMFVLRSEDGKEFEVEEAVVTQSGTLKRRIEDVEANDTIPVPNLMAEILCKVIEYCKKHAAAGDRSIDDEIKAWDADFVKVDDSTLYDLLIAANYLEINELMDLICQTIAEMKKGKLPEPIGTLFNIKNDLTPEEEELLRGV